MQPLYILFVLLALFIYEFSVAIVSNYRRFLDSSFLSQSTARLELHSLARCIFQSEESSPFCAPAIIQLSFEVLRLG
jgi:hypothetical protein